VFGGLAALVSTENASMRDTQRLALADFEAGNGREAIRGSPHSIATAPQWHWRHSPATFHWLLPQCGTTAMGTYSPRAC